MITLECVHTDILPVDITQRVSSQVLTVKGISKQRCLEHVRTEEVAGRRFRRAYSLYSKCHVVSLYCDFPLND